MLDHTIPGYIFIQICIYGLRAVTPLSILYASFSIAEPPTTAFGRFLLTWSIIETAFWLLVFLPRKRALQSSAHHPPPLGIEERKALFWKCWDNIPHPEYYLSRWFLGARIGDIKRENVREFFEWALLNRETESEDEKKRRIQSHPDESRDEQEELDGYADGIQTMLGGKLEPGRGSAKSLRLTIDEVRMLHRPVIWYFAVLFVDTLTATRLRVNGFILYRTSLSSSLSMIPPRIASLATRQISSAPDLSYWYRPHTSKTRLPILFIHGIGIGLYPYVNFLSQISKDDIQSADDGEVGVIALEIMPICFHITKPILRSAEICRQVNIILAQHGFDKVVLASHSYGSVVSTHLLKDPTTAAKIGPIVFIDPVTFLLHLPDVAYNFTARTPRYTNELQLYYFASTDMMIAHTLARHFFWAHNILWKEDLHNRRVTVSLGGRDLIVDTDTIGKYLNSTDLKSEDKKWKTSEWKGDGLETLWWPTADHSQVFERKEAKAKLVKVLLAYTERTEKGSDDEKMAG
ncbi:hypothetical protein P153DRAFT_303194 [Dothidotthia symphoricarpi CBS 119687]|uniref:AB hydrolase-1 domain-containing protein n=1 Tax=Dothidotthia symphoricarpi CBS 119687 TaxID=1392245 RepID=A0A6A6A006_9PLEO|nr:uncharacterized protein P153DRAFT_303194 [Dothidotthia symphoricarpi CBS 119687]KAF2123921.1 hypothetical protein P153DRAFT_303194 [Dothidotthia symphoricarpi CBS 119687]